MSHTLPAQTLGTLAQMQLDVRSAQYEMERAHRRYGLARTNNESPEAAEFREASRAWQTALSLRDSWLNANMHHQFDHAHIQVDCPICERDRS